MVAIFGLVGEVGEVDAMYPGQPVSVLSRSDTAAPYLVLFYLTVFGAIKLSLAPLQLQDPLR